MREVQVKLEDLALNAQLIDQILLLHRELADWLYGEELSNMVRVWCKVHYALSPNILFEMIVYSEFA